MHDPQRILLNGSHPDYLLNLRGDLIKAFVRQGHEVHVSSPDLLPDYSERISALGAVAHDLPLERTGTGVAGDLRYFLAMRALIGRLQPDLVLSYTIKPNIWGSLAARSHNVRSATMVTGLGYAFAEPIGWKSRLIAAASKRLYRLATNANAAVIFQNPDDRDDFIAAGCLGDPTKAKLVNGSGVDLDHFAPMPLPQTGSEPGPDAPVFLLIARLLIAKGVREYAQAAATLKQRHPQWRFLLVGFLDEGPDSIDPAELEQWTRNGIEYLGEKHDIRPVMGEASVYVLPSYREGTPRSILEAMAIGRPVVTADTPGCRETVVDGENGLLVPARDAAALTAAMQQLGEDPALRARMAGKALERVRQKYAVDLVNAQLTGHLNI